MKKLISTILVMVMLTVCFPLSVMAEDGFVTILNSGNIVAKYSTGNGLATALNDAFEYCEKNANSVNRLTVSVPNGTYAIDKSLIVSSFTTLELNNSSLTLASAEMTNMFCTQTNGGYTGCDGFTLANGNLSFANGQGGENCLIRVGHAQNITFDNVKIKSSFKSHMIEVAASRNVVVNNCEFDGVNISACRAYAVALQIDILNDEHFPGYEPYDGTSNDGISVTNCRFYNVPCGVGTHSLLAGFYQNNINIENNVFDNITSEAVSCMSFTNVKVTGNTITNCGCGVAFNMMKRDFSTDKTNTSGVGTINTNCGSVISSNSISVISTSEYPVASPIYIFGNDVTNKNVSFKKGNYYVGHINVSYNNVSTTGYGIRLSDTKYSTVEANTVVTSSKDYPGIALYEASESNTIVSNSVTGGKVGIATYTSSNNNSITYNTLNNSLVQGILLNEDTMGSSVTSNVINYPGQQGIYVRSKTSGAITGNTIFYSGHNSIYVKGTTNVSEINYNYISNASGTGIYIEKGTNVPAICGNTVSDCAKFGIKTLSNVTKIENNTLKNNKQYGLCLDKGVSAKVYKNKYSGNKGGAGVSMGTKSLKFSNLGTVKISSVKKSGKNAVVKWKKVSSASKYEVYRATSKNGKYSKIATVKDVKYTDKKVKKGKTYYYKVKAIKTLYKSTLYGSNSSVKKVKM